MSKKKKSITRVNFPNSEILSYEEHLFNGKLHREDGPAFIRYHSNGQISTEEYCKNGRRHREDGPARVFYEIWGTHNKSLDDYYFNGQYIEVNSLEEFKKYIKLLMFK